MLEDSRISARLNARRILHGVILCTLIIIVVLFIITAVPQLIGADNSYAVLSDSMSPTINAGAVVFVADTPPERIAENDVLTFEQRQGGQPVTHRVVEVDEREGERHFRTKGDANEDSDPGTVTPSQILGTVIFSVPLIGYVISFANTDLGLLSLVIIPATLLAILEIRDLLSESDMEDES